MNRSKLILGSVVILAAIVASLIFVTTSGNKNDSDSSSPGITIPVVDFHGNIVSLNTDAESVSILSTGVPGPWGSATKAPDMFTSPGELSANCRSKGITLIVPREKGWLNIVVSDGEKLRLPIQKGFAESCLNSYDDVNYQFNDFLVMMANMYDQQHNSSSASNWLVEHYKSVKP